jgi:hypothetical protein
MMRSGRHFAPLVLRWNRPNLETLSPSPTALVLQLLSGRWVVMLDNLTRQNAKQIKDHLGMKPQPMTTTG